MVERGPADTSADGAAARLRQFFPTVEDLHRRARWFALLDNLAAARLSAAINNAFPCHYLWE